MKYADRMKFASMVSKAAQACLAKGLESFKGDAHMIGVYRQDSRDMRNLANLLREGKLEEAVSYARDLDTVVREAIPTEVYTALMNEPVEYKNEQDWNNRSWKSIG